MVLMPLLSRLLTLLVILTMPLFLARLTLIPITYLIICFSVNLISISTVSIRCACLSVPMLTLMTLIKMMLVMVSVAAISKTFGLLRFLLRLSLNAKSGSAGMPRPISYAVFCLKKKKQHTGCPRFTDVFVAWLITLERGLLHD